MSTTRDIQNDPMEYRGWSVSFDMKPIPIRSFDWSATHPDYDVSWEGEEEGWHDNGLKAFSSSYEDLCSQIDEIEDEDLVSEREKSA